MIHPRDLLRSDFEDGSEINVQFSAPIDSVQSKLDCGLQAFPCCSNYLEKYAKARVFIILLCIAGLLNGANLIYFRNTSQIWGENYKMSSEDLEWFTYINEVLVGLVALLLSYWGNRIHRPTWIGAFTIFLSIFSLCLIIPEIYFKIDAKGNVNEEQVNHVAIALLLIYQLFYACGSVCILSLGISYADDNILNYHSPSAIGLILASTEIGKQVGAYFSWIPVSFDSTYIFIYPIWISISIAIFIIGTFITMFPKVLPTILTLKNAASLISVASVHSGRRSFYQSQVVKNEIPDGFFKSFLRLLKNKIFMTNLLSFTLIQSAILNFDIFEIIFNQTKYHVPKYDLSGYHDPSLIQFTTNLLKQPLVCISVIACGFIIAKSQPQAKKLVLWNISVFILIILFFASTKFFDCTKGLSGSVDKVLLTPACSLNKNCSKFDQFHPVCVDRKKTYFSPCMAGCDPIDANDYQIYKNCSCATMVQEVIEGSCDQSSCTKLLAIAQVNSIICAGLLATTIITTILINIRCNLPKDKALTIGVQTTFIGLIPYIPVRLIYNTIIGKYCKYYRKDKCVFFDEAVPLFLSASTIFLILLAVIVSIIVYYLIGDLEIFANTNAEKENDMSGRQSIVTLRTPSSCEDEIDNAINELSRNAPFLNTKRNHSESEPMLYYKSTSKEDRINKYVEDGDLVPSLSKLNAKNQLISHSSELDMEQLARQLGDDHDSIEHLQSDKKPSLDSLGSLSDTDDITFQETNF